MTIKTRWRTFFGSPCSVEATREIRLQVRGNTRNTAAGSLITDGERGVSELSRNQHRHGGLTGTGGGQATPQRGASSDLSHRSVRCARPASPTATGAALVLRVTTEAHLRTDIGLPVSASTIPSPRRSASKLPAAAARQIASNNNASHCIAQKIMIEIYLNFNLSKSFLDFFCVGCTVFLFSVSLSL